MNVGNPNAAGLLAQPNPQSISDHSTPFNPKMQTLMKSAIASRNYAQIFQIQFKTFMDTLLDLQTVYHHNQNGQNPATNPAAVNYSENGKSEGKKSHYRTCEFFIEPISGKDYPDYYDVIKKPICLREIYEKFKRGGYRSMFEVWDDVELMCDNAQTYNKAGTFAWIDAECIRKEARKMMSTRYFQPPMTYASNPIPMKYPSQSARVNQNTEGPLDTNGSRETKSAPPGNNHEPRIVKVSNNFVVVKPPDSQPQVSQAVLLEPKSAEKKQSAQKIDNNENLNATGNLKPPEELEKPLPVAQADRVQPEPKEEKHQTPKAKEISPKKSKVVDNKPITEKSASKSPEKISPGPSESPKPSTPKSSPKRDRRGRPPGSKNKSSLKSKTEVKSGNSESEEDILPLSKRKNIPSDDDLSPKKSAKRQYVSAKEKEDIKVRDTNSSENMPINSLSESVKSSSTLRSSNASLASNESQANQMSCIFCVNKPSDGSEVPKARNLLFLPCTHILMCADCGSLCDFCPRCGQKIESKVNVRF